MKSSFILAYGLFFLGTALKGQACEPLTPNRLAEQHIRTDLNQQIQTESPSDIDESTRAELEKDLLNATGRSNDSIAQAVQTLIGAEHEPAVQQGPSSSGASSSTTIKKSKRKRSSSLDLAGALARPSREEFERMMGHQQALIKTLDAQLRATKAGLAYEKSVTEGLFSDLYNEEAFSQRKVGGLEETCKGYRKALSESNRIIGDLQAENAELRKALQEEEDLKQNYREEFAKVVDEREQVLRRANGSAQRVEELNEVNRALTRKVWHLEEINKRLSDANEEKKTKLAQTRKKLEAYEKARGVSLGELEKQGGKLVEAIEDHGKTCHPTNAPDEPNGEEVIFPNAGGADEQNKSVQSDAHSGNNEAEAPTKGVELLAGGKPSLKQSWNLSTIFARAMKTAVGVAGGVASAEGIYHFGKVQSRVQAALPQIETFIDAQLHRHGKQLPWLLTYEPQIKKAIAFLPTATRPIMDVVGASFGLLLSLLV